MTKTLNTSIFAIAFLATSNIALADDGVGKKTYDQACAACHTSGVAGAPKTGDLAVWAPRIATGKEALYASAINGKGIMPAKGGQTAIPDGDIKAAVDYIISASTKL